MIIFLFIFIDLYVFPWILIIFFGIFINLFLRFLFLYFIFFIIHYSFIFYLLFHWFLCFFSLIFIIFHWFFINFIIIWGDLLLSLVFNHVFTEIFPHFIASPFSFVAIFIWFSSPIFVSGNFNSLPPPNTHDFVLIANASSSPSSTQWSIFD